MFCILIVTLAVLCAANAFMFMPATASRPLSSTLMEMFDDDFKQMSKMMSSSLLSSPQVVYPRRKAVVLRPTEMIRTISDDEFFGPEVNSLFNSVVSRYSGSTSDIHGNGNRNRNTFNIDYLQNEERLEISADLPGFRKSEVRIEVKDHMLVISAEKQSATETTTLEDEAAVLSKKEYASKEDKNSVDTATEEVGSTSLADAKIPSSDRILLKERTSFQGSVSRSIQIPKDCDESNIVASLEDGVLTVIIPRMPPQQPKVISIS